MIDDKIVALINRDIDGVTSHEEHGRIEILRSSNREIERLYDGLLGLSKALAPPELVEPPQTLESSIMRDLANRQQHHPHPTLLQQTKAFAQRQWNWQTGVGFTAGVALGVLMAAVLLGSFRDSKTGENELVGTILLRGATEPFKEGETLEISRGKTEGEITTSYSGNMCLVRFSLHSSAGSRSELLYDHSAVSVSSLYPSEKSSSPIEVQNGRIAIGADFNDTMLVVFAVHGVGRPVLHLKITDAGGEVVERSVALVSPGGE